MAQVNPETALGEGTVSVRTIGTAASRRRASLTKSISVLVAKTQTGGYKLEVDPLMPLVISSGVVLAACAGMVNAIAFETSETLVSHVTGAVSKVSLHTVGEHAHAGKMVLLVSFFLLGSMISGCIIKRTAVKMAYMGYGVAMTASALLRISSLLVFKASEDAAVYILCVACGLQNGIMSSYTGSVIRTTHMTGIVTDVGLITGRHLVSCFKRKCCHKIPFADEEPGETRKLILLLLLLLSFLLGVAAGSGLARALHELSLLVPAAIALMAGTGYMLWTYLRDDIQDEVKILQAEGKTSSSSPKSPVSPSVQPLKAVDAEATDQPCSPVESLAPPTADDVDP